MKKSVLVLSFAVTASACAPVADPATPPEVETDEIRATPPPPPATARTVEEFDTTSASERAEAARPDAGGRLLGSDIASLGDPSRPGFWLETALVSKAGRGRVSLPGGGPSVEVDLLPSETGSRLSLAALRVLEVPLTDLPTVEVYAF